MPKDSDRIQRIIQFIESLTVPSGKGKGEALRLRTWQKAFIRDIYGSLDRSGKRIVRRAILSMARKNGKGLALDTVLPTPQGWTTMGSVEPGDILYDETGRECRVSYVSEIREVDCYKITFSNGEEIICDGDHLWLTTARVEKPGSAASYPKIKTEPTKVRNTRTIFETQIFGKRGDRNHSLTMPSPIIGSSKNLLVDPYVLGVWLGDGNSGSGHVTCGKTDLNELVYNLQKRGIPIRIQPDRNCFRIALSNGREGNRSEKVQSKLRKLGVLGNKHIPPEYLRASFPQRLALLQGLMDTDGTCDSRGRAQEIATTSDKMLAGISELLASLGIKYSVREKPLRCNGKSVPGIGYYLQFCCMRDHLPVFTIPRKLWRQRSSNDCSVAPRSRSIQIVSVEKIPTVPTKCIQVNSSNGLFLCGRSMIPTHNTLLTAALVLVHLVGPEAEENGEIYSAANDRDQAAIVFRYAAQLVRAEPELASHIEVVPSTKTMVCRGNGSIYRAVSAEAGTKYGLNPTMVIFDELAQARDRELYDALDTSMAARSEPLFIVISTQSNDPQHILSQLIDDGLRKSDPTTVCHVYAVDENEEDALTNEKLWRKANPALGDFRSLSEMRTAAKRASRMPTFESAFRNLYLNQRVNAESPLIPRAEWVACKSKDNGHVKPGSSIYLGLDLSGKTDLTALVGVSSGDSDEVAAWFWKPQETLIEHEKRDRVPYTVWKKQGILETTPGKAIQYEWVAARLARILKEYQVVGLAFDRYRIDDLLSALNRIGVDTYIDTSRPPEPTGDAAADARERQRYEQLGRVRSGALRMVPWGQGYKDMTPAVEALEGSILQRKLTHDGNPILTWNASNAITISDPAGGRKLDKSATRFRIDGIVALAMALGLKSRDLQRGPGRSIYEGRGVIVL